MHSNISAEAFFNKTITHHITVFIWFLLHRINIACWHSLHMCNRILGLFPQTITRAVVTYKTKEIASWTTGQKEKPDNNPRRFQGSGQHTDTPMERGVLMPLLSPWTPGWAAPTACTGLPHLSGRSAETPQDPRWSSSAIPAPRA